MRKSLSVAAGLLSLVAGTAAQASTVVLYDQDFENPDGYVNDGGDINIFRQVNDLYSTSEFAFAQAFTVETLNISGSQRNGGSSAFGTGYNDPTGTGENFALGMLSSRQNDLIGLSFDVGDAEFFNLGIDVSSIDLDRFGAPFVPVGATPTFRFTLFDNPTGNRTTGSGTVLDSKEVTGTASAIDTFDWSNFVVALSTDGNTNGNVTLQIDLLTGGYAALDNLRITASDDAGDLGVPLPAAAWLFLSGAALAMRKVVRKER